jgi:thiol-disulfide isomerase/thioredoxin/DNA-binding beta-propeller fold protein YncE
METIHAPRLNAGNLPWFNVKTPLDLPDLKGKLVILDFWTLCCINCIHIIPTLKRIEEKFPESLVVIGVHSPKFPGEKVTDNLKHAIDRYEIVHPIVHDPDFTIWKNYAVRAWPTLIFIDPDGYILGQLPGEPDPELLDATLAKLIEDMNKKGVLQGNAAELLQPPESPGQTTLRFPGKIAFSESDNEFAIADCNHNQIVTADRTGKITRRIGSGAIGHKDGDLDSAEFFRPQGLCYHDGIIWVADTENHLIRKIDLAAGRVESVAGNGRQGPVMTQQESGVKIGISSPWDVSLQGDLLYFANAGTHQIGVYNTVNGMTELFAGTGQEAITDAPRLLGTFAQTSGLSIGEDKLFLADSETSAIRSIQLYDGGFIETLVGTGLFDFGDRDGKGKDAILQHPLGVHYADGKVYIADSYNHKIRVLDLETQEVTTVKASVDLVCDDTSCTRLWEPAGVLKLENSLYVSDTNNHRILRIDLDNEKTELFIQ